jgi:hypothetical protein
MPHQEILRPSKVLQIGPPNGGLDSYPSRLALTVCKGSSQHFQIVNRA